MTSKTSFLALTVVALSVAACSKSEASAAAPAEGQGARVEQAPAGPVEGRLVEVKASLEGYSPKEIAARAGETLTLRFTRTADSECIAEIVFPSLNIRKPLPLNTPVDIVIKAEKAGEIKFQCGMAMLFGKIVVS